jgi:hypothetical protein
MGRLLPEALAALVALFCLSAVQQIRAQAHRSASSVTGCLLYGNSGDRYKIRNPIYPQGVSANLPPGYRGDVGYEVTLSGDWDDVEPGGQVDSANNEALFSAIGVTDIERRCSKAVAKNAPPKRVFLTVGQSAQRLILTQVRHESA